MRTEQITTKQFYKMVNHDSGLLGISETSSDMRDLLDREKQDVRAAEAVALFCYQATKWIGSFAFHGYPWLIHRLTYRRTNQANIHVRGYKEEGTITTPFDLTVLNDLDRFHLVMDTIDRVPQTGEKGCALK